MSNIQIESDLKDILNKFDQKLDYISDRLNKLEVGQARLEGKIEAVDEKLSGKIEALDEKLSGKIEAVDEKLSGKVEALDTKVDQLDKRISNSELTNRGILIGLVVIILGGAAKLFGLMGNP
jgi:chromosome segregation ATPase